MESDMTRLPSPLSHVDIAGTIYGATPDYRGGIGGGDYRYVDKFSTGEHVVTTTDELIAALGLATSGEVIFIPGDVELDFTGRIVADSYEFLIPAGVIIASDRGSGASLGAIIKCETLNASQGVLNIDGNDVRITGLRLQGPTPERFFDHWYRAFVDPALGSTYYYDVPVNSGIVVYNNRNYNNVEVDNCEIYNFTIGVSLSGQLGTTGHKVHHCYIHDNYRDGLGYGVGIDDCEVEISYNVFDRCRHGIAATGGDVTGYEAHNNIFYECYLYHIDMHQGPNFAGKYFNIHHNTFMQPGGKVGIQGSLPPSEPSFIQFNWFIERSSNDVIITGNTTESDNLPAT